MDDTMAHLSNTGEPCAMKVARTVRRRTVGKVPPQGGNSLAVYPTERTRQALRIVDAMSPCVAMIDEGEQRFQLVIPILAPLADMQREVDLGVGGLSNGHP